MIERRSSNLLSLPDGFPLPLYTWSPTRVALGAVVLVHGMGEHARRYEPLAQALAADGYLVLAYDQRGHGAAITKDTPKGHVDDEDSMSRAVDDLTTVVRYAQRLGFRTAVVAHSFGATVARSFLVRRPEVARLLAGAVLSSTSPRFAGGSRAVAAVAALEAKARGPRHPSTLMASLVFGPFNLPFEGRTPFDWISNDRAVVDAYVADPLCGFPCSSAFWRDMMRAVADAQEAEEAGRVPSVRLLTLAGTQDPLSVAGLANGGLADAYARAGADVTDVRFALGRHEVLNTHDAIRCVLDWLAEGRGP